MSVPDSTDQPTRLEDSARFDILPPPPVVLAAGTLEGRRSRFRPLRPLGRGGLGEVHVALDEELHREVALKEVQARFLGDPDSVRRFVREAEVTGRLEHPGVVPVYGLGAYPDGRPYYAMRLIRGESLESAIQRFHEADRPGRDAGERSLSFRTLLSRFVAVCNAVAYAHSRGVLHRDLKPANVMLGPFGETLVIDWGLAKVLPGTPSGPEGAAPASPSSGDALLTDPGVLAGTPAYMSPEQAAGDQAAVGPTSDVYALGAILYAVLTGQAPFRSQLVAILAEVQQGAFVPPQRIKTGVPRALAAICLKAMALSPSDRYATATELAADVERWFSDEPVLAYREPLMERARRWGRRHRTLVASLGVLLLTTTAALAVGLLLVQREQRRTADALVRVTEEQQRTEEQRRRTEQALAQVQEEKGRTEQALERSRTAERSAAQQRRVALHTVRAVVGDILVRLKDRPDTQQLRKDLLGRAAEGLREVERTADTAQAADHAAIRIALELGDIYLDLDDGGTERAERQYETALVQARRAGKEAPQDGELQRDVADALIKLGLLRLRQRQPDDALKALTEAEEILRRRFEADRRDGAAERDLAVSLAELASAFAEQGDRQAALRACTDAVDVFRRRRDAEPSGVQARNELAVALVKLGDVRFFLFRRREEARKEYEEGEAIAREVLRGQANDLRAQRILAVALERRAYTFAGHDDTAAARRLFQEDRDLRRSLADADSGNALARRELAVAQEWLGTAALLLGDLDAARLEYEASAATRRRLAEADRNSVLAQGDRLMSCRKLGLLALQTGDFAAAGDHFRQGLDLLRTFPRPEVFRREKEELTRLAALCRLGETLPERAGQVDEQTMRAAGPPDQQFLVLCALARAHVRRGEPEHARTVAVRTVAWARSADEYYEVARTLAVVLALSDEPDVRAELADQAVELLRQARAAGFRDVGRLREDRCLDALRDRADFRALLD
jgi:tetratricopeptide (TPR) repeat protein